MMAFRDPEIPTIANGQASTRTATWLFRTICTPAAQHAPKPTPKTRKQLFEEFLELIRQQPR
jgi:hypothetical protein